MAGTVAAGIATERGTGRTEMQPLAGRDWKSALKDDIKSRHFLSKKQEDEKERLASEIIRTLVSIVEMRPLLKRLVEKGMAEPKFFETATRSCQEKLDLIGWDKLTFKVLIAEMERRKYAIGMVSKDDTVDFPRLFSMLRECKRMSRDMLKGMVALAKEPPSDTEFGTFTPFFTQRNIENEIDYIILEEPRFDHAGNEGESRIIDFSIGGTGMAKQFSVHMKGYRTFFYEMMLEYGKKIITVPWIPVN
jgi:hypothetical protein